ncbi:MAG TPA: hypothetical protein VM600_05840, partial [Actinomycetota bacterium]|nr:hypothetical protein [Actinomycetota bacterium]
GVATRTSLSIGASTVAISIVVLLLWIPLRQRVGLGTLSNGLFIGVFVDLWLLVLPETRSMAPRVALVVAGVVLNGVATGLYIGAGLGPGPRDGLMTGLAARGRSVRLVRTAVELLALALGWILGGTVGVGTLLYALGIGPIAHVTIPHFTRPGHTEDRPRLEPFPTPE